MKFRHLWETTKNPDTIENVTVSNLLVDDKGTPRVFSRGNQQQQQQRQHDPNEVNINAFKKQPIPHRQVSPELTSSLNKAIESRKAWTAEIQHNKMILNYDDNDVESAEMNESDDPISLPWGVDEFAASTGTNIDTMIGQTSRVTSTLTGQNATTTSPSSNSTLLSSIRKAEPTTNAIFTFVNKSHRRGSVRFNLTDSQENLLMPLPPSRENRHWMYKCVVTI